MSWPIPQPQDISGRASAVFESELARVYALRNPSAPPAKVDARSPNSLSAVHARVTGMSLFDIYLFIARNAIELMPDTAQDWLSRHGNLWGVPQVQATFAAGNVNVAGGVPGEAVPADEVFNAPGGAQFQTTASVTIASDGTASLPIQALVAGTAGNMPTSTVLTLASPLAALPTGVVTVDTNAITGGAPIETTDSWRARIVARIRQRGAGGDANDYQQWTQQVLSTAIVKAISPGPGEVTVVLAMPGTTTPRVPTSEELAVVTAYVTDSTNRKPLGMTVTVIAATLTPVNVTLHLNPDTVATEAGATAALQTFFLGDGAIGATIYMSRLDSALSVADGEFSHERSAPTADVTVGPTAIAILGTVTFD